MGGSLIHGCSLSAVLREGFVFGNQPDISDFLTCKTVFLVQVLLDLLLAFSVNRAVGNRRYKVRHLHFSDRGIAEFISIDSFQEMRQFLSHSMVVGGGIILQDGIKNRRNRKPVETRFAICVASGKGIAADQKP